MTAAATKSRPPPPPPRKKGDNKPPPPPPKGKKSLFENKANGNGRGARAHQKPATQRRASRASVHQNKGAKHPVYVPVEEVEVHEFTDREPPPDDLIKLSRLEEGAIVGSLRDRYRRDAIYTYVGTVLISVNPYHVIDDLYTPIAIDSYATTPNESIHDNLPPHIFAIASGAYHGLMSSWQDQAILISGESGAGKTEACKLVLEYLMEMSARAPKQRENDAAGAADYGYGLDRLENQCMQAQTIFESFGNAKTVRNNNSSRFGKWIEVLFGHSGHISGAHIKTYLLEKSRLTRVDPGERKYHVFYQMLAYLNSPQGAGDDRLERFKLKNATWKTFAYLRSSSEAKDGGHGGAEASAADKELAFTDSDNFDKLVTSLNIFGLNPEAIDTIMQLLAAILHLGNIKFANKRIQNESSDTQGSVVAPPPPGRTESALTHAASLMGVSPEALERAMCYSSVTAGKDVIEKPNSVDESYRARDALAKGVYEGLFKWIGSHINRVMKLSESENECTGISHSNGGTTLSRQSSSRGLNKVVGILDIFGFESLQTNSFKQICINYCNEKLHFHFNEECFRIEQQEYVAEGVCVENVPYIDNAECIEMFEASGKVSSPGIFALIDAEVHAPGGSEPKLLENMYGLLKDRDHLSKPHPREGDSRHCFKVTHYAGAVVYNSAGLLEKSRDTIHQDIRKTIMSSSFDLMRDIAEIIGANRASSRTPGKSNKATLGTQFCKQLSSLMAIVNAAYPHFVKCMKPNDKSQPKSFMVDNMVEQLRCAGILSLCQLRKVGFCERISFDQFVSKYSCLTGKTTSSAKDLDSVINKLSSASPLHRDGWVRGHTKIMLKMTQYTALETELVEIKRKAVARLEAQAKAWLFRKALAAVSEAKKNLAQAMRREVVQDIESAMASMEDVLPAGAFPALPVHKKAKNLLQRLRRESEAESLLRKAIESRHIQTINSALKAALELGYKKGAYVEAEKVVQTLLKDKAITDLREAVAAKSVAQLEKTIANATSLGMEANEDVAGARKLLKELTKPKPKPKAPPPAPKEKDGDGEPASAGEGGKVSGDLLTAMEEVEKESPVQEEGKDILSDFGLEKDSSPPALGEDQASSDILDEFTLKGEEDEEEESEEEPDLLAEFSMAASGAGEGGDGGIAAIALTPEVWRHVNGVADILSAKFNANAVILPKDRDFFVAESLGRFVLSAQEGGSDLTQDQSDRLVEIRNLCDNVAKTSKLNENLKQAVYTKNLDSIYDALEAAEAAGLESPYMEQARALQEDLRKTEMEKNAATAAPSETQILEIAKGSRWRFDKFVKLRSREDFVSGKWLGRRRLMDLMLQHQKEPLPNSLTTQNRIATNRTAIATFKCLLGATGIKKTTFPAAYAHEILKVGLKHEELRDEVLIQQLKQIHNNQDVRATYKGWLLLSVYLSLFCPSIEFELHLINFLLFFREHKNWGQYAEYCLAILQKQFQVDEVALKTAMKKIALPSVDQLSSILQGKSSPFIKNLDDDGAFLGLSPK